MNDELIDAIAKDSGGDIRNAITSLQYFSLKPHPMDSLSVPNSITTYPDEKQTETGRLADGVLLPFGKDATLSLFHALGKFLHNKRETESIVLSGILMQLAYVYHMLQVLETDEIYGNANWCYLKLKSGFAEVFFNIEGWVL